MMEDAAGGKKENTESFTMTDEDFNDMIRQLRSTSHG